MERAVISALTVWDASSHGSLVLCPGVILRSCHITRFQQPATYLVEFEVEGRTYRCPLHGFQPRTQLREVLEEEGQARNEHKRFEAEAGKKASEILACPRSTSCSGM